MASALSAPAGGVCCRLAPRQPLLPDAKRAQHSVCAGSHGHRSRVQLLKVCAKTQEEEPEKDSFFTSITNALDFSAIRSAKDAELLSEAKNTIKDQKRMSAEQYGALKRKVGGTAKSYFKEFIDVQGEYTDEGWVDKTCRYCKKDTSNAPRQKDSSGRYAHIECAENAKARGNVFTRLFRR